jgi:dihydrofolate reductase
LRIITRFALTLDGFAADPDGLPAILAAPDFDHGKTSHGFPEFLADVEAVAMGRTTFEPAVDNEWWPWPDRDVHVLTSRPLPDGEFPSELIAHADAAEMVAALRGRYEKDVHLVGGPRTIGALLELGAIDRLVILLVPALFGEGLPFALPGAARRPLRLEGERTYPDGTIELSYTPA